ncbi:hypothetical protein [Nostoc sp. C117]|uniref:hypothetical protein n=1 Tax=Nostoc sp. C117 TaxID=3349875 RepID=UPI00370DCCB0
MQFALGASKDAKLRSRKQVGYKTFNIDVISISAMLQHFGFLWNNGKPKRLLILCAYNGLMLDIA